MAEMKLKVSITDTDIFKNVFKTVSDLLEDERISPNLREEYRIRVRDIVKGTYNI